MKFKHLFVVTYGRSGSTLLTGVLNLVPGMVIRGENHAVLAHLYRAVRAAQRTLDHPRPSDQSPRNPWFGASDVDPVAFQGALVHAFVSSVLAPPEGAESVGFKEIRHRLRDFSEEEFLDYLDFLREAFEAACFVFNVRRHANVARSAWWAQERGARRELAEIERRFRLAADRHSDISAWVEYDRVIADPRSLMPLFDFLDAPFDEAAVSEVLATPHSYQVQPPPPSPWRALGKRLAGVFTPGRDVRP